MENGAYACNAIKSDNTLWVWGSDSYGQLGLNGAGAQSSPIQIPGSWSVSSGGNYISAAIKTNGSLWVWGDNAQGVLGQNETTSRSSPIQVGVSTGTTWKAIHMDNGRCVATKTDGTLWCWGNSGEGAMGNNRQPSSPRFSSPNQVGESTDWGSTVGGAWINLYAFKTDGTMWIWGDNTDGALGLTQGYGYLNGRSSPTQLPAPSGRKWSKVTGGYVSFYIANRDDGTLWSWGRQDSGYGNLGHNEGETRDKSAPIQIGTGTDWSDSSASAYMGSATKTDGTLWSWGYNHQGQLGHNDIVFQSSPTQVPGTNWKNTNNPWLGNLLATQ